MAAAPTFTRVTRRTLAHLQPEIIKTIGEASWISMDCEFTGLGEYIGQTRAKYVHNQRAGILLIHERLVIWTTAMLR